MVGVNTWSATAVITGATTWGAFEGGQTIADVGSGIGAAGNSYLVAGVQKAVYRCGQRRFRPGGAVVGMGCRRRVGRTRGG